MKTGFIINANGKQMCFELQEDGLTTIHIHDINNKLNQYERPHMRIETVGYKDHLKKIWCCEDLEGICRISLGEVSKTTMPSQIKETGNIPRPLSKLERFRQLECILKEKGLI